MARSYRIVDRMPRDPPWIRAILVWAVHTMQHGLHRAGKSGVVLVCLVVAGGFSGCHRSAVSPDSVTIGYANGIVSLDPYAQDETTTTAVLAALYEPLVRLSPDLELVPCLADTWTTPSPVTWRLHIRQGVLFHDGRELGVSDVLYSLHRAITWSGSVVAPYLSTVKAVRTVPGRPGTIEIETIRPTPLLLVRLTMIPIVPVGFDASHPVGTGPYRFGTLSQNGSLLFTRWNHYWGVRAPFRTVHIDAVRTQEQLAHLVRTGAIDVMAPVSRSFLANHRIVSQYRIVKMGALTTMMLGLNLDRKPLGDVRVRRAIRCAIDRAKLVKTVFPSGDAQPAVSFIPAGVFGFTPICPLHRADFSKARELLKQAGVTPGTAIDLSCSPESRPAAAYVKGALANIGLSVHITLLSWPEPYERLLLGRLNAFFFGWNFPFADSSDFLEALIHSRDPRSHLGLQNGIGYANSNVDRWIEQIPSAPTIEARRALIRKVLHQVCADVPLIPLYHQSRDILVKRPFTVVPRQGAWTFPQDVGVQR